MIAIAKDDSHGYDQQHRLDPDYDCSSLVAAALIAGGFNVSAYSWTGNLKEQLLKCGFKEVSAPWKVGDIHLNEAHHVCMQTGENQITQTSIIKNISRINPDLLPETLIKLFHVNKDGE